jgi:hypothetical protein
MKAQGLEEQVAIQQLPPFGRELSYIARGSYQCLANRSSDTLSASDYYNYQYLGAMPDGP